LLCGYRDQLSLTAKQINAIVQFKLEADAHIRTAREHLREVKEQVWAGKLSEDELYGPE
jgi:hypothetical protein